MSSLETGNAGEQPKDPRRGARDQTAGGDPPAESIRGAPDTRTRPRPGVPPAAPPVLPRGLEPRDATATEFVQGHREGELRLIALLKRTYDFDVEGRCTLADEQEPLTEGSESYEESASGLVPPPRTDEDFLAFRKGTDVVLQGSAQSYGTDRTLVDVTLRGPGGFSRTLRVLGDRVVTSGPGGSFRVSDPQAFSTMPVTYDRAYGGLDAEALSNLGDRTLEIIKLFDPEMLPLVTTRWHYPRNPCGMGYLARPESSLEGLRLPNVTQPDRPLGIEELRGRGPERWPLAPLPAGFDWIRGDWFPRCAYLGEIPDRDPHLPIEEVARHWAPGDLMDTPSVMDDENTPARIEYAQGASPGMVFRDLAPGTAFEVVNLHPTRPRMVINLPTEVPGVRVGTPASASSETDRSLNSVVLRTDSSQVVMTWCCSVPIRRPLSPEELLDLKYRVQWQSSLSNARR